MKTNEKRRGRRLLASLVADPYRKLASVALAIGLWFYLHGLVTRDVERVLKLEFAGPQRVAGATFNSRLAVLLPTDQVVGQRFLDGDREVEQVKLSLSGQRYRVDTLVDEALDLQITKFLGTDWTNRSRVEFTAFDIQRNVSALQGVHLEMRPSRIAIEVQRIEEKPLPLTLEQVELIVDEPLGSRLKPDTVVFSPDTARLLGPASSLAQFPSKGQKPLLARLRTKGPAEKQLTAVLELVAPAELGLHLAETPSLTVQLLPDTKVFELDLPLRVDDLALPPEQRGLYRPEQPIQRGVRIRAGGELRSKLVSLSDDNDKRKLAEWAAAHLRLDVWIPPVEPGASYGPELVREARLFLRGPMQATVDRAECDLDKPVSITLRRQS